jgi:hypothetical protein
MASKLRASTKKILEPAMAKEGFSIRYPYFQRKRNGRLELVNLEHDKWGGGFFLEFAECDAGDLQTSWGEIVPEAKIDVAYTDPGGRARLLATTTPRTSPKDYFRYDSFADNREKCDALIEELVSLLPQVLRWFESGVVGPNVAPFSDP